MDLFLVILILIVMYQVLRCFLRGTVVSLIDITTLLIAVVIGTSFFKKISFFLYTTDLYIEARKSITGMINYNAIMNHNGRVELIVAPDILEKFAREYTLNGIGTQNYADVITNMFTHLILITISFLIVFCTAYFVMYVIRVLLMPQIKIIEFGVPDKIIAVVIGILKSILIIFVLVALIPILLIQFNYEIVFKIICDSPVLNYLYNIDPVIKGILNGVYLK